MSALDGASSEDTMSEAHTDVSTNDDGFSIVELMIVVLIIGVLLAIAIPVFLGARTRAQDKGAQSNLRTSIAAALTEWSESGSYTGFTVAVAEAIEPSLHWKDNGGPGTGQILIQVAAGPDLLLVTKSGSGRYFCLRQRVNSPVWEKGQGATFPAVDTLAECTGGW
jgi:type IV pilus assembly protein PilA